MGPAHLINIALFVNPDYKEKSMKKLLPALFTGFAFLFLGFSITRIVLEDPSGQGRQILNTSIRSEAFQRKWT